MEFVNSDDEDTSSSSTASVFVCDSVGTELDPRFQFWNRFRNFHEVNRNKVRDAYRQQQPNQRSPQTRERWFPNQLPDSGNEYEVRVQQPKPPPHPVKKIEITKVNSSCALECIRNEPPEPEEESINRGNEVAVQQEQQQPPSPAGSLDQRDDDNYLMDNFLKKHLLKEDKSRNKPQAQEVPYFSPSSESKVHNQQAQAQQNRGRSDPPRVKPQTQQEIAPLRAPEVQETEEPEAGVLPSLFEPPRVYNRSCTEFKLTLQNILRDLGVICENGTKLFGGANGGSKMNLFVHLPFPACKVVSKREARGAMLTHAGRLNVVYRLVPSSCRKQRSSLLFGLPGQQQQQQPNGTENNSYNVQIFVLNKKMTAPLIIQLKDIQDFGFYSPKTKNSKGEKAKKKAKTKSAVIFITKPEAGISSSKSSTKMEVDSGAKNKRNTGPAGGGMFVRYLESSGRNNGSVRNGLESTRNMTNLTLNETEINSILESMGHLYPSSNAFKFPTKNLTDPRIWSQIQNETDKFAWGHQI